MRSLVPSRRRWAVALLCGSLFLLLPPPARGNGWEHGAIPFEALLRALGSEHAETRRRAAESLGYRGQPEAVEPLLARLALPEEAAHVRSAIFVALGRLGDRRAAPALGRCLDAEPREEVRGDCALALGMLGDPGTAPRLVQALEEASFLVRSRAVDALGSFSDPGAVTALGKLVAGERNPQLRLRAIRALGRTRAPAGTDTLLAALAAARTDPERLAVVEALTDLRPREAVKPLAALLGGAAGPELRAKVAIALGAIQDGDALPTMVRLLGDDVPAVRYYAAEALGSLARPEAVPALVRLSLDISRRLLARPVATLVGDLGAVLAELSIQEVALRALAALDAPRGLEAFLAAARPRPVPRDSAAALALADGLYEVRRTALVGLGQTRSARGADFLAGPGGTGDGDFRLRATAVRSLGVLGFPRAAAQVEAALGDLAAEVRWTAAAVLGRLGQRSAVEPLLRRLGDPHAEVRRQAALGLGYLGDPRAHPALRALAREDPSEEVRAAAAHAADLTGR